MYVCVYIYIYIYIFIYFYFTLYTYTYIFIIIITIIDIYSSNQGGYWPREFFRRVRKGQFHEVPII